MEIISISRNITERKQVEETLQKAHNGLIYDFMMIFSSFDFWLNSARIGALIFTGLIAWLTYRSHLLLKDFQPDFNLLLSVPESIVRIILVLICLGLAWLSGLPASQLGLTTEHLWWSVGLGAGVGLITQLVANAATVQAIKHLGPHVYSPWLIRNILPRQRGEWPAIALAFIPPIVMEELLFRSLLIGLFQTLVPLPLLIGLTSVIFGLMHQPQGKLGMIAAGVINVLFCLLFIWTGELLVTLVAHYVVNMLQVVAAHHQQGWLEQIASEKL